MSLEQNFQSATERVKQLRETPSNDVLLDLYGLFKQATEGDVSGKRPGFTNPVGRAKYDAWAALEGSSPDDARAQYIAMVDELVAAEG